MTRISRSASWWGLPGNDSFSIGRMFYQWLCREKKLWRQRWRGVRCVKPPTDYWNYQQIFSELNIQWILETGTKFGGSAYFYADMLDLRKTEGVVVTVDIKKEISPDVETHPRVRFILGDSKNPAIVEKVKKIIPPAGARGPLFISLDSAHDKTHVLGELRAYVPLLAPGDYLVVEDTIYDKHKGPLWAINDFDMPSNVVRDEERENMYGGLTCAYGGYFKVI